MSTIFLPVYLLFACLQEHEGLKGKKTNESSQSPCREKKKINSSITQLLNQMVHTVWKDHIPHMQHMTWKERWDGRQARRGLRWPRPVAPSPVSAILYPAGPGEWLSCCVWHW